MTNKPLPTSPYQGRRRTKQKTKLKIYKQNLSESIPKNLSLFNDDVTVIVPFASP
jgi:hypothetical protein